MTEPLAVSIFLDCSKCGARLTADFEASGYVDGIIVQVEPCENCIQEAHKKGYKKCDSEHECAF